MRDDQVEFKIAKGIRRITQNWLTFSGDSDDIERYEELLDISMNLIANCTNVEKRDLLKIYDDKGYATPR